MSRVEIKIICTALLILLGLGAQLSAQNTNPEYYLEGIKAEMLKIENYTADIEIEVDVDFIDMPVKRAYPYRVILIYDPGCVKEYFLCLPVSYLCQLHNSVDNYRYAYLL